MTPNERRNIDQYLDDLIESDRAAQSSAMMDALQETFALTPEEATEEYRRWEQEVA